MPGAYFVTLVTHNHLCLFGERFGVPIAGSIPTIIRSYKSSVTQRFQKICQNPGAMLWQRNYYEHVIRNDADLRRIREYICNNPPRWALDREKYTVFVFGN